MLSEGSFNSLSLSAIMGEVFNRAGKKFLVLTISDKESEKYFVFEENEITLLSLGSRKQALLGDMLVKTGRISEENLSQALQEQHRSKDYLGNILIYLNLITEEEIKEALLEQVYEELFDLITWEEAYYQFDEQDRLPDFNDPTIRMTKCEYNTHLLAVEVCKQLEHWEKIKDALPNMHEVYQVTGSSEDEDLLSYYDRRVIKSIDGYTPLSHLMNYVGLSMFRCLLSIDRLKEFDLIESTPSDEIRELAETIPAGHPASFEWNLEECADAIERDELIFTTVRSLKNVFVLSDAGKSPEMKDALKREDPGGAISVLLDGKHNVEKVIQLTGSNELDVCRVFGRMLRSSLIRAATPSELKEAATDFQIEGDLDSALALLTWTQTADSEDPELLQDLAIVTAAKGNRRLAAVYYKQIAEISREAFDYERAIMALTRVSELTPESFEVNSMLAAVFLLRGEEYREAALTEFGQALAKLTVCGLYEQSQKVVDDILRLIPNDEELRKQLLDLTVKIGAAGAIIENRCPNCKEPIDPEDKECSNCGTQLVHQCMTCGEEVRIGSFICSSCGKDPYSLPTKGQKGYTLRLKKAEGSTGFVRFKLLDALEKSRKAVSESRFSQAIETLQEAQKLQPYNEALKTELEEIRRLAEEHEENQQQILEETKTISYKTHFLKRLAVILSVVIVICVISGAIFLILVDTGKEENDWNTLVYETQITGENLTKEELLLSVQKINNFLNEYPETGRLSEAKLKINQLLGSYEELAKPQLTKIEPLIQEFNNTTPVEYLSSLKKQDIEGIAGKIDASLSLAGNFIEEFPQSRRIGDVKKLSEKLMGVKEALKEHLSDELIEKNAEAAYAKVLQKAEEQGYSAAEKDFKDLIINFNETGAALKAQNIITDFEGYIARHEKMLEEAVSKIGIGKYDEARNLLNSFQINDKYSRDTETLEKHKQLLSKITTAEREFDEALGQIQKNWDSNKISVEDYRRELEELKRRHNNSGWEFRISNLVDELNEKIDTARNYKAQAEKLNKEGKYLAAYQYLKHLIEMKHTFISLEGVEFFVSLDTTPSGALVAEYDGASEKPLGTTPCTVCIPYAMGSGTSVFVLTKKGYARRKLVISAKQILSEDKLNFSEPLISTFSDKWILNTPIDTEPIVVNCNGTPNLVYIEGRALNFLGLKTGDKVHIPLVTPGAKLERPNEKNPDLKTIGDTHYWKLKIQPQLVDLKTNELSGQYVVVAGSDGKIYIVDPKTRTKVHDFGLSHKYNIISQPIFMRPALLLKHQMVYFAANNGIIYCYDMQTKDFRWKYNTNQFGDIKLYEGKNAIFASLSTGRLICLDLGGDIVSKSGKLIWENNADDVAIVDDLLYCLKGGNIYVWKCSLNKIDPLQVYGAGFSNLDSSLFVVENKIIAFEKKSSRLLAFADGIKIWETELKASIISEKIGGFKDQLIIPLSSGKISVLNLESGKEVKTLPSSQILTGELKIFGDNLLYATEKNEIILINMNTNITWSNEDIKEKVVSLFSEGDDIIVVTVSHVYRFENIIGSN